MWIFAVNKKKYLISTSNVGVIMGIKKRICQIIDNVKKSLYYNQKQLNVFTTHKLEAYIYLCEVVHNIETLHKHNVTEFRHGFEHPVYKNIDRSPNLKHRELKYRLHLSKDAFVSFFHGFCISWHLHVHIDVLYASIPGSKRVTLPKNLIVSYINLDKAINIVKRYYKPFSEEHEYTSRKTDFKKLIKKWMEQHNYNFAYSKLNSCYKTQFHRAVSGVLVDDTEEFSRIRRNVGFSENKYGLNIGEQIPLCDDGTPIIPKELHGFLCGQLNTVDKCVEFLCGVIRQHHLAQVLYEKMICNNRGENSTYV